MAIRGGGNPFQRIGEYRFSITDVKLETGLIKSDKKCRTVVPNRSGEGQRTEVNSHFSNG